MANITSSAVLLRTADGKYLFQQRDKYAPKSPNMIATFGGHLETGESPIECLKRELWEELELKILPPVECLGVLPQREGENNFVVLYIISDIVKDKLKLHEGRAIVELSAEEALQDDAVHYLVRDALKLMKQLGRKV